MEFGNDFAENAVIFGVFHAHNHENNFLVLGRGRRTYHINGSFGSQEEKFRINFSKTNTTFCLSLHYNGDNSYLFANGKEIFKFKAKNKNINFPTQICLGSISNGFSATTSTEVSLKGNGYDVSVDYSAVDKSNIVNIHKYLMVTNYIK